MDFNKLTTKAQEAIAASQELARRNANPEIYPEHLLLALLTQELPQTLAERAGPGATALAQKAEADLAKRPRAAGAANLQVRTSSAFDKVLDRAEEEMRKLDDEFVSVEHLLLALDVIPRAQLLDALKDVRGGQGTVIEDPCGHCQGSGRERRTKRYTAKIPAGVKDGTRIRLKGKGESGFGSAPAGDLFVTTRVAPSRLFARRGASDLELEVPVTYPEAALGATVEVPTPYGQRLSLKVPAGSEDGKLLKLRGHGAPSLKGGKGDLVARLRVAVPKKLSKKEREAIEALQKASREDPREALF